MSSDSLAGGWLRFYREAFKEGQRLPSEMSTAPLAPLLLAAGDGQDTESVFQRAREQRKERERGTK